MRSRKWIFGLILLAGAATTAALVALTNGIPGPAQEKSVRVTEGSGRAIADGSSHPVSSLIPGRFADLASARAAFPLVPELTPDDEVDWCALTQAIRAASSAGGGEVVLAPRIYIIGRTRTLRLLSNLTLRGEGAVSRIARSAEPHAGPGVAVAALPDHSGAYGDADGFILAGGDAGRYLDLAQCVQFTDYFPTTGAWSLEVELRYDSGSGPVWTLGGEILSTDLPKQWLQLSVGPDGRVTAYANFDPGAPYHGWRAGVTAPALTPGAWNTVKVAATAAGSATLTVAGTEYPLNGTVAPVVLRWFDRLLLGQRPPALWPGGFGNTGSVLNGRVKNVRLATRYGDFLVPLTGAIGPNFPLPSGGHLFAKPFHDQAGIVNLRVRDLTIDAGTQGEGLYVNNAQRLSIRDVTINQALNALHLDKNVYSADVQGCQLFANRTALQCTGNAGYGTALINNFYSGSRCGIGVQQCYGISFIGGWVQGTFAPGTSVVVTSARGAECLVNFHGLQVMDEGVGTAPARMLLLRDSISSVTGCGLVKEHFGGTVVTVDGRGPHAFTGSVVAGVASSTAPLFEKLGTLRGKVVLRAVDRGASPPQPWTAAANDPDFATGQ